MAFDSSKTFSGRSGSNSLSGGLTAVRLLGILEGEPFPGEGGGANCGGTELAFFERLGMALFLRARGLTGDGEADSAPDWKMLLSSQPESMSSCGPAAMRDCVAASVVDYGG